MTLRTDKMPSGRLKINFGEDRLSKFQGVERPYEIFFYNLRIDKNFLDEVF
jgi:hypothetical protein